MLSPGDIRDVFLACQNNDPNGMYAFEVDLIEFANKVEKVLRCRLETGERWPKDFQQVRKSL